MRERRLPSHSPPGEKRGNTSWVACRACETWFHVTSDLLDRGEVSLHCPKCHDEFAPAEAAKIVRA
jgi:hypothetical protein